MGVCVGGGGQRGGCLCLGGSIGGTLGGEGGGGLEWGRFDPSAVRPRGTGCK